MRETPDQQAKRDAGSRQVKYVSSSAPDWAIYGGCCRDLIGQPVCGLSVLISWEPRARSLARAFQNVLGLLVHVCPN